MNTKEFEKWARSHDSEDCSEWQAKDCSTGSSQLATSSTPGLAIGRRRNRRRSSVVLDLMATGLTDAAAQQVAQSLRADEGSDDGRDPGTDELDDVGTRVAVQSGGSDLGPASDDGFLTAHGAPADPFTEETSQYARADPAQTPFRGSSLEIDDMVDIRGDGQPGRADDTSFSRARPSAQVTSELDAEAAIQRIFSRAARRQQRSRHREVVSSGTSKASAIQRGRQRATRSGRNHEPPADITKRPQPPNTPRRGPRPPPPPSRPSTAQPWSRGQTLSSPSDGRAAAGPEIARRPFSAVQENKGGNLQSKGRASTIVFGDRSGRRPGSGRRARFVDEGGDESGSGGGSGDGDDPGSKHSSGNGASRSIAIDGTSSPSSGQWRPRSAAPRLRQNDDKANIATASEGSNSNTPSSMAPQSAMRRTRLQSDSSNGRRSSQTQSQGQVQMQGWMRGSEADGTQEGPMVLRSLHAIRRAEALNTNAGVGIEPSRQWLHVVEGGAASLYSLRLLARPRSEVRVKVTCSSMGKALTVRPREVVFPAGDRWSLPQTVNVTAVDDGESTGSQRGIIVHQCRSEDARYGHSLPVSPVLVIVVDADSGFGWGFGVSANGRLGIWSGGAHGVGKDVQPVPAAISALPAQQLLEGILQATQDGPAGGIRASFLRSVLGLSDDGQGHGKLGMQSVRQALAAASSQSQTKPDWKPTAAQLLVVPSVRAGSTPSETPAHAASKSEQSSAMVLSGKAHAASARARARAKEGRQMAAQALSMKQRAKKEASDLASQTLASFVPILGLGALGTVTVYPSDSMERMALGRQLLLWRNDRIVASTAAHQKWWCKSKLSIGEREAELSQELRSLRGDQMGDSEGDEAVHGEPDSDSERARAGTKDPARAQQTLSKYLGDALGRSRRQRARSGVSIKRDGKQSIVLDSGSEVEGSNEQRKQIGNTTQVADGRKPYRMLRRSEDDDAADVQSPHVVTSPKRSSIADRIQSLRRKSRQISQVKLVLGSTSSGPPAQDSGVAASSARRRWLRKAQEKFRKAPVHGHRAWAESKSSSGSGDESRLDARLSLGVSVADDSMQEHAGQDPMVESPGRSLRRAATRDRWMNAGVSLLTQVDGGGQSAMRLAARAQKNNRPQSAAVISKAAPLWLDLKGVSSTKAADQRLAKAIEAKLGIHGGGRRGSMDAHRSAPWRRMLARRQSVETIDPTEAALAATAASAAAAATAAVTFNKRPASDSDEVEAPSGHDGMFSPGSRRPLSAGRNDQSFLQSADQRRAGGARVRWSQEPKEAAAEGAPQSTGPARTKSMYEKDGVGLATLKSHLQSIPSAVARELAGSGGSSSAVSGLAGGAGGTYGQGVGAGHEEEARFFDKVSSAMGRLRASRLALEHKLRVVDPKLLASDVAETGALGPQQGTGGGQQGAAMRSTKEGSGSQGAQGNQKLFVDATAEAVRMRALARIGQFRGARETEIRRLARMMKDFRGSQNVVDFSASGAMQLGSIMGQSASLHATQSKATMSVIASITGSGRRSTGSKGGEGTEDDAWDNLSDADSDTPGDVGDAQPPRSNAYLDGMGAGARSGRRGSTTFKEAAYLGLGDGNRLRVVQEALRPRPRRQSVLSINSTDSDAYSGSQGASPALKEKEGRDRHRKHDRAQSHEQIRSVSHRPGQHALEAASDESEASSRASPSSAEGNFMTRQSRRLPSERQTGGTGSAEEAQSATTSGSEHGPENRRLALLRVNDARRDLHGAITKTLRDHQKRLADIRSLNEDAVALVDVGSDDEGIGRFERGDPSESPRLEERFVGDEAIDNVLRNTFNHRAAADVTRQIRTPGSTGRPETAFAVQRANLGQPQVPTEAIGTPHSPEKRQRQRSRTSDTAASDGPAAKEIAPGATPSADHGHTNEQEDDDIMPTARLAHFSSGGSHALGILSGGVLVAQGCGQDGQHGTGDRLDAPAPRLVVPLCRTPIVKVAAGGRHSVVIAADGVAFAFGCDETGCCGLGPLPWSRRSRAEGGPGPVGARARARAAGPTGHSTPRNAMLASRPVAGMCVTTPLPVLALRDAGERVTHASCGDDFTLFLTARQRVFTCGRGDSEQLGVGKPHSMDEDSGGTGPGMAIPKASSRGPSHPRQAPVGSHVVGTWCLRSPTRVALLDNRGVFSLDAGSKHSVALGEGGRTVFVWGSRDDGRCGEPLPLGGRAGEDPSPAEVARSTLAARKLEPGEHRGGLMVPHRLDTRGLRVQLELHMALQQGTTVEDLRRQARGPAASDTMTSFGSGNGAMLSKSRQGNRQSAFYGQMTKRGSLVDLLMEGKAADVPTSDDAQAEALGFGGIMDASVEVPTLATGTLLRHVEAGGRHTALLSEHGDVFLFGSNSDGQLLLTPQDLEVAILADTMIGSHDRRQDSESAEAQRRRAGASRRRSRGKGSGHAIAAVRRKTPGELLIEKARKKSKAGSALPPGVASKRKTKRKKKRQPDGRVSQGPAVSAIDNSSAATDARRRRHLLRLCEQGIITIPTMTGVFPSSSQRAAWVSLGENHSIVVTEDGIAFAGGAEELGSTGVDYSSSGREKGLGLAREGGTSNKILSDAKGSYSVGGTHSMLLGVDQVVHIQELNGPSVHSGSYPRAPSPRSRPGSAVTTMTRGPAPPSRPQRPQSAMVAMGYGRRAVVRAQTWTEASGAAKYLRGPRPILGLVGHRVLDASAGRGYTLVLTDAPHQQPNEELKLRQEEALQTMRGVLARAQTVDVGRSDRSPRLD